MTTRPLFQNEVARRQWMAHMARYCLGVSLLPAGVESLLAAETTKSTGAGGRNGKRLIYLFMNGAMSQLDTFDPKPKSDVQGDTKAIQTAIPGVQFGDQLPELAKQAKQLAIIRSMNTSTAAHEPARYLMSTSYKPIATTRHPGLGSWMHVLLGRAHKTLPASVQIGGGIGPGYLGAEYAPVPIGDPALGLQNTKSPSYLTDDAFDKRMQLSQTFDTVFRRNANKNRKVTGYDDLYRDAIGLLRSEDLKAFDINQEPEAQRKAYGDTRFAKGCLLARRLIESGVRYVEVSLGTWDHHYELWDKLPTLAADLDHAASALLKDLNQRGLLQDTLVVIGTEFGRKPEINQNTGRDHHPAAYSCVLAGAGVRGGQVYGATDENAFHVEEDGVTPEDFNATIAHALGMPHDKEIFSPDGRPFTLANGGSPLRKLF